MKEVNLKTVNGKLKAVWECNPDKVGMVFYDDEEKRTCLTHKQIQTMSEKCAFYLSSNGVQRGDIVCNMLYNSMEREIVNFGILLAGAVVMHGDAIEDTGRSFWTLINQAKVKYMILEPDPLTPAWKMLKSDVGNSDALVERCTSSTEAPGLQKVFKMTLEHRIKKSDRGKVKSCFDIINEQTGQMNDRISSHDPCAILVHKEPAQKYYAMVLRSHQEICAIAMRIEEMMGCSSDDIVYSDFPLSWLPGLPYNYISLGCTRVRSTLTDCPPRKIVAETWDLINTEKCTMAALQPPMIQMLSSYCEDIPEPHHRLKVLSTTETVRQAAMDAIGPVTEKLCICYSRIETGMISCLLVDEKSANSYSRGCVGALNTTVRTRLEKDGKPMELVKPTAIGEILLDGAQVAKGYYNNPELTKSAFTSDGFLLTGDIGFYNETRQLFVLGRKSEAIIRGNIPIFPSEIEEKVNQCPGIWKVKVVSLKDDKDNLQMCACVIPRDEEAITIERVKEFCRYQLGGTVEDDDNPHMPTYIFFFDSFPTVSGKVNRRMLSYLASEILHGNNRLQN